MILIGCTANVFSLLGLWYNSTPNDTKLTMKNKSTLKQIKQNLVALISLFIAISSLTYNTWRNEQTEFNRNQRLASFEIIVKLNELQQIVCHHVYDNDTKDKGNLRTGWAHVLTIQDFSKVLNNKLIESCDNLQNIWNENWQNLSQGQKSIDNVLKSIDKVRSDILVLLILLE